MIARGGRGFNRAARVYHDAVSAFIGLGSNLGDRAASLTAALERLGRAGLRPGAASSVWETEPVGGARDPWFWNMVARVETDLAPLALLDLLLELERRAGRTRTYPNAPRTLDLDLLLVDDLVLAEPRLELPHPRMWERRFVLEPLAEIAPALRNPRNGRTVAEERDGLRDAYAARRIGPLASLARGPV